MENRDSKSAALSANLIQDEPELPLPSLTSLIEPFLSTLTSQLRLSFGSQKTSGNSKYANIYNIIIEIRKLLSTSITPFDKRYHEFLNRLFSLFILTYKINNNDIIISLLSCIQSLITYKYFIFIFNFSTGLVIEDSIASSVTLLSFAKGQSGDTLANILIKLLSNIALSSINNNIIILHIVHIFILLIQLPFTVYNDEGITILSGEEKEKSDANGRFNHIGIFDVINDNNSCNNNINENYKIDNRLTVDYLLLNSVRNLIFNYKTTVIHSFNIIRIVYVLYTIYITYNNNVIASNTGNNIVIFNTIYITTLQIINYYFSLFNNLYILYYYVKYYYYNNLYITKLIEKKKRLISLQSLLINEVNKGRKSDEVINNNYTKMRTLIYSIISHNLFNIDLNTEPGKYGYCIICSKSADHYCIYSYLPICSLNCKYLLINKYSVYNYTIHSYLQDYPYLFNKFIDAKNVPDSYCSTSINPNSNFIPSLNNITLLQQLQLSLNELQYDALILFRLLCILSYNNNISNSINNNVVVMKQLSLSLIYSILEHTIKYHENTTITIYTTTFFINLLRNYLINSLLVNCVSYNESIITLSLKIFKLILVHSVFKYKLKYEIGILLNSLLFSILSSSSISIHIKVIILHFFYTLSLNYNVVIDLFMFYDCNTSNIKAPPPVEEISTVISENISNDSSILTDIKTDSSTISAMNDQSKQSPLIYTRLIELIEKISKESMATDSKQSMTEHDNLHKIKYYSLSILINIINALISVYENANEKENDLGGSQENKINESSASVEMNKSVNETENAVDTTPSQYKKHKIYIEALEKGISKFNVNANDGINYLINEGIIQNTPSAVASFLLSTPGLNKTLIGEYLGQHSSFCINVLYAFTNTIDFSNMAFDIALRHYLEYFRLPGEAQKIDRMMEKFADKYCNDNKDVFSSPDIAYVLAYSVIMLNTDAHSPQIKNRMTKQQFINNSKHIYHNNEVNEKYLEGIYDRIVEHEIILNDSSQRTMNSRGNKRYIEESLLIIKKSKNLLNKLSSINNINNNIIVNNTNIAREEEETIFNKNKSEVIEAIILMISKLWLSALASFSICFETESDNSLINICLNGYQKIIHLLSILNLSTEREVYITSLCNMTCLLSSSSTPNSMKEMKEKNIMAIKVLLRIGEEEGNYLNDSWFHLLRCISEIDRLHNIYIISSSNSYQKDAINDVILSNSFHIHGYIESNLVDHIFTSSSKLNNNAILYFVKYLCIISKFELNDPNCIYNNVFSLQKIVEITYFNMNRVRYIWRNIWDILSEHIIYAATTINNNNVCVYAIDSLRQLSLKFLEYDELLIYHYQYQFLFPFEVILTNYYRNQTLDRSPSQRLSQSSKEINIPDFIIRCISHLISNRKNSIRSGWKCIFNIFCIIASNSNVGDSHYKHHDITSNTITINEQIVQMTFEIINNLINNNINLLSNIFDDVLLSLITFSHSIYIEVALSSLNLLLKFVGYLAAAHASSDKGESNSAETLKNNRSLINISANLSSLAQPVTVLINNVNILINLLLSNTDEVIPYSSSWLLILYSLCYLIDNDTRIEIRIRASQILFSILLHHGSLFNSKELHISVYWRLIYEEMLFPIFFHHHLYTYYFNTLFTNNYINECVCFNRPIYDLLFSSNINSKYKSLILFNREWIKTTSFTALSTLVELFIKYYSDSHLWSILHSLCYLLSYSIIHNHFLSLPLLSNETYLAKDESLHNKQLIFLLIYHKLHYINTSSQENDSVALYTIKEDDTEENEELTSIGYRCFVHLLNVLIPSFQKEKSGDQENEMVDHEMKDILMSLCIMMLIELPYELVNVHVGHDNPISKIISLDVNLTNILSINRMLSDDLLSLTSFMNFQKLFSNIYDHFSSYTPLSFSILDRMISEKTNSVSNLENDLRSLDFYLLKSSGNVSFEEKIDVSIPNKGTSDHIEDKFGSYTSFEATSISPKALDESVLSNRLDIPSSSISLLNSATHSESPFFSVSSQSESIPPTSFPPLSKSSLSTGVSISKPITESSSPSKSHTTRPSYFLSPLPQSSTNKKERPVSLSSPPPSLNLPSNRRMLINKCKMQISLLNITKHLIINHKELVSFNSFQRDIVIFMLHRSLMVAKQFNNNLILRLNLYDVGFLKDKVSVALPELFLQESHATYLLYTFLLNGYTKSGKENSNIISYSESFLIPLFEYILKEYYLKDRQLHDLNKNFNFKNGDASSQKENLLLLTLHDLASEVASKEFLVEYVVNSLFSFRKEQFFQNSEKIFPLLFNLIEVSSLTIRCAVHKTISHFIINKY